METDETQTAWFFITIGPSLVFKGCIFFLCMQCTEKPLSLDYFGHWDWFSYSSVYLALCDETWTLIDHVLSFHCWPLQDEARIIIFLIFCVWWIVILAWFLLVGLLDEEEGQKEKEGGREGKDNRKEDILD